MGNRKSYSRYFIILQEDEKGHSISADKQSSGYTKIETKNDKCKVSFYVQNIKREKNDCYMFLIANKKDTKKIINLGVLNIDDNGRADVTYECGTGSIGDTNISMEKVGGAAIGKFIGGRPIFIMSGFSSTEIPSGWKEYSLMECTKKYKEDKNKEKCKEKYKEKEKEHDSDDECRGESGHESANLNKKEEIEETKINKEKVVKSEDNKNLDIKPEKKEEEKSTLEIDTNETVEKSVEDEEKPDFEEYERKIEKSKEVFNETDTRNKDNDDNEKKDKDKCDDEHREEDNETIEKSVKDEEESDFKEDEIEIEKSKEVFSETNTRNKCKDDKDKKDKDKDKCDDGKDKKDYKYEDKIDEIEDKLECKCHQKDKDEDKSKDKHEECDKKFDEDDKKCDKDKDKCKMPKDSAGQFFLSIMNDMEEIKDVCKEIKYCRWFKQPVSDLESMCNISNYNKYTVVYYPMMNYYPYIKKYGYYVMGLKCDKEDNLKYLVYAMPGTKNHDDQPFGGKTGFVTWVPIQSDGKHESLIGYWLMFYDFKNSTIVVPMK